ncbi:hypothetical protein [Chitinophaga qingshengii]|uniref:Uncharacterized protein n=1 Tax=Chitinophaga qingshengii TaxID=1569794 RepID=A0ABR7TL10_9BACT|nr:hypothetical protein [Chitinophaga qingshengii]MBC9930660.1 hypothetical protein [Chitinophaga qingshengii]
MKSKIFLGLNILAILTLGLSYAAAMRHLTNADADKYLQIGMIASFFLITSMIGFILSLIVKRFS